MKRLIVAVVVVLIVAAASIDCLGFAPGIYGFC
jgi:hypothetical protein